ncbi:protein SCO1/2 [Halorientalis persicus]|jgi:protein SCO1/2|uniref:Protein SCO1/2 n=1 Tax=Halorientalis persicus TaxID=1367881 RepID=A0A1H8M455_9EURY|nr:SCO family protein [Halorientalis persicus]SEO11926.1 protein SCO1/2 [Halorientalis persicus]
MNRRRYLQSICCGAGVATAGCLETLVSGDSAAPEPVLDPPKDQQFDSEDIPYPAYGERLPDFTLPDPLRGRTVDTADLDETLLVTGFFATCPAECISLISRLTNVQAGIVEDGLTDATRFLAITFDPERDDAEALRAYGERLNVDFEAGNWHFLRPESVDRAEAVVDEKLGITFDRVGAGESSRLTEYDFIHLSVTFLRNPDGVVERAYRTDTPDPERLRSDVSAVVDAY